MLCGPVGYSQDVVYVIVIVQVNQKLLYRESDWWDVGLVAQKARKQGTIC